MRGRTAKARSQRGMDTERDGEGEVERKAKGKMEGDGKENEGEAGPRAGAEAGQKDRK